MQTQEEKKLKNAARAKAWREAHPEQARAGVRAWVEANKDRKKEGDRAYREANKERLAKQQLDRRLADPEKQRAYHREYYRSRKESASVPVSVPAANPIPTLVLESEVVQQAVEVDPSKKVCTKCTTPKDRSEFHVRLASPDGLKPRCKLCCSQVSSGDYQEHRQERIAQAQLYVETHRDQYNAYRRDLQKRKMADPVFRMSRIVRTRLNHVLKGRQKTGKSVEYLGCTYEQLKEHIEAQFLPGMAWENHGTVWHVDHQIPLATLTQGAPDSEVRRLSHYTNLRPLWAEENMSLGGKLRHAG